LRTRCITIAGTPIRSHKDCNCANAFLHLPRAEGFPPAAYFHKPGTAAERVRMWVSECNRQEIPHKAVEIVERAQLRHCSVAIRYLPSRPAATLANAERLEQSVPQRSEPGAQGRLSQPVQGTEETSEGE